MHVISKQIVTHLANTPAIDLHICWVSAMAQRNTTNNEAHHYPVHKSNLIMLIHVKRKCFCNCNCQLAHPCVSVTPLPHPLRLLPPFPFLFSAAPLGIATPQLQTLAFVLELQSLMCSAIALIFDFDFVYYAFPIMAELPSLVRCQ